MPEHLVLPVAVGRKPLRRADHPPIPSDVPVFDALAYLSYLAGRTEQIRFGTHVYNIGLRHPFVVARAVATLDVVSGGRAEFGIGRQLAGGGMGGGGSRLRHPGPAGGRGHRGVPAAVDRAGHRAPR